MTFPPPDLGPIVLSEFLIGRKRSKEMEFLAKWVNNINLCVCISNLLNLGFKYISYLALSSIFYSCNINECVRFLTCVEYYESHLSCLLNESNKSLKIGFRIGRKYGKQKCKKNIKQIMFFLHYLIKYKRNLGIIWFSFVILIGYLQHFSWN